MAREGVLDEFDADLLKDIVGDEEPDPAGEPLTRRMKIGELPSNELAWFERGKQEA